MSHIKNLKPFRLTKNHNETRIFIHENLNLQNDDQIQHIGQENNNMAGIHQQNINEQNLNHIHLNPIRLNLINENPQNEYENLNQINNLEIE